MRELLTKYEFETNDAFRLVFLVSVINQGRPLHLFEGISVWKLLQAAPESWNLNFFLTGRYEIIPFLYGGTIIRRLECEERTASIFREADSS